MATTGEAFDQIAHSWYRLRHWSRFRPELEELARRWHKGKLLNIGCAHGPDFLPFTQGFELWGMDSSKEMIKLAINYSNKFNFTANLAAADAASLPYPDATFDWAISIATYHHIKGDGERAQAFRELRRVLKPKGEAFITVWNRWQPRFWLKPKEVEIPWRLRDKTIYRYHHLFSYHELSKVLSKVGFKMLKIFPEKSYHFPIKIFSRNICVLVKRD